MPLSQCSGSQFCMHRDITHNGAAPRTASGPEGAAGNQGESCGSGCLTSQHDCLVNGRGGTCLPLPISACRKMSSPRWLAKALWMSPITLHQAGRCGSSSSSLPPLGQGIAVQGGGRMEELQIMMPLPLPSLQGPSTANKEKGEQCWLLGKLGPADICLLGAAKFSRDQEPLNLS